MRDTIDMAREAGLAPPDGPFITWGASDKQLKAFEALVRADEREACAKVCEAVLNEDGNWTPIGHRFAAAIRARGQA
jgi:hypothetical protein